MKKSSQFLPILKKDLRLVFNVKTLIIIVFVPFIMMFLIIGLPTLFIGASNITINIYSADVNTEVQHVNGTPYILNLGASAIQSIQLLAENSSQLDIVVVESRAVALESPNGIFIPANFTSSSILNSSARIEYHRSASPTSIQGIYFDQALSKIQETIVGAFLFLNLEAEIPSYEEVEFIPPAGEPTEGWTQETLNLAAPFAYALFIMIALIGNMGRTIGFSKEKEDGTFETMLTITKNRSYLVLSKLIVGIIASTLSILAYFSGSAIAGALTTSLFGSSDELSGLEGILALPMGDLLSFKGVILLIGLGISLVAAMLALMTVDTIFSRTVAERLGTSIVMGFGILFYFAVAFDPGTTAIYAQINPFYWIYHSILSLIDLSYGWIDAIYTTLFVVLLIGMVFLARRAIERERVLFS
ncbi:MAG TPA: ABC transporter permease [candidate division Zixibacteria bacterium]|nr:ABC transporter permease [candidate division Zixibacteria bacterium]